MKFYLPNFEDLVDPEYGFMKDEHSPKRKKKGRFHHDWYAHQFFDEPIFDGMLISKTVITPGIEELIRQAGGVHAFCRLKPSIPVMGDCGAFSYRDEKKPPYEIAEILTYYETLGFTYGIALDHLIFPAMPTAERDNRLEITLNNARAFIEQHRANGYNFKPVGIIQGWDPSSRREAFEKLLAMGYEHLAIGGMARSNDKEIRETLQAIHPILPPTGKLKMLHLFGVARLSLIPDFIRHGITSADSAAPLRRAFLGTSEDNYWTFSGERYAAIRVPEIKSGGRKKRGIESTDAVMLKNGVGLEEMKQKEQKVLQLLRDYAKGKAGLEETLQTVLDFDRLHGDTREHEKAYRRTLKDRPWQQCSCPICRDLGIEVIIFRGNNRNRRRGFHNVKVFYEQFCRATESAATANKVEPFQLPLI